MAFYAGYNHEKGATRIGNWVEEEALKETTGLSRYHRWVDQGQRLTRKNGLARGDPGTATRVIAHSNQEPAKEWNSTVRSTFGIPAQHPERNIPRKTGLRGELADAAIIEKARKDLAREHEEAELKRNYAPMETVAHSTFVAHSVGAGGLVGRRRMKTQMGKPLPARSIDRTFLAEAGLRVARPQVDGDVLAQRAAGSGGFLSDVPVTLYTQRVADGSFARTAGSGPGTFRRNAKFTSEIVDGVKPHAEGVDTTEGVPPGMDRRLATLPGAELSLDEVVARVRDGLRQAGHADGVTGADAVFARMDTSGDGLVSRTELRDGLQRARIELPERDLDVLFAFLDEDASGALSLPELARVVRHAALPKRRRALLRRAFERVDRNGDGALTPEDLASGFDPSRLPGVRSGRISPQEAVRRLIGELDTIQRDGRVSYNEFEAYYAGVSATVPDDAEFEAMLCAGWQIPPLDSTGAATHARVLVRHHNGRQETVDVPLAHTRTEAAVRKYVHQRGVHSIKSVEVLGESEL